MKVIVPILRLYNACNIEQRPGDGYLNATAMCKATGKLWADYYRLSSTKTYMEDLSADMGIPISDLIQVRKGGSVDLQGTWIHPDLAIHLAQWCSSKFAIQVTKWVRELLTTGQVALEPGEPDPFDLLVQSAVRLRDIRHAQRETEKRVELVEGVAVEAHRVATAALGTAQSNYGWYTILGYCRLAGRSVTTEEASRHGRELVAKTKAAGKTPGRVRDTRWGQVYTYPEEILRSHFGDEKPAMRQLA